MKVLAIVLVVLCQYQNVSCEPIFQFMVAAITDVASTLTRSIKNLKDKIKSLFAPNQNQYEKSNTEANVKKKPFTDVVEKIPLRTGSLTPSTRMTTTQMIIRDGWKAQTHIVLTQDGYLLTVHRILPSLKVSSSSDHKTVLLHHGLLGSSADWILLGPKKSLPYLLSEAGYDVWMTNARGNIYSRSHFSMKVDSSEFWKFSWQEMGEYDLPAVIDYIRKIKESTELIDFVGHSMGGTALLVLLSTQLRYNDYLRMGILMAPLAFMSDVDGPIKHLGTTMTSSAVEIMDAIGADEFAPSRKIPDTVATRYCHDTSKFCSNPLFFISGGIPENGSAEPAFIERLLFYVPAGGSTNTILHYAQVASNNKFHKFDDLHSEFPLNEITLPIALLSSGGDLLATVPNILRLYLNIKHPIEHYVVQKRNLTHTEFLWGMDADELVFSKIIDVLKNGVKPDSPNLNEINYVL